MKWYDNYDMPARQRMDQTLGPTSVPYPEKDTKIPAIQSRQLHTYGARSDTLQILTHAHNLHRVKPARSKATVCRELPTQNPYITNSIKHDSTMFIWIWYDIASYNTPWTTTGRSQGIGLELSSSQSVRETGVWDTTVIESSWILNYTEV